MADVSKINGYDLKDAVARQELEGKQDELISGLNIKTINGESILGEGNITIASEDVDLSGYASKDELDDKQDKLVSGTNIKTINGESILGSGDITVEGENGVVSKQTKCGDGDSYIHLSFDDVTTVIGALAAGNLNSIYDNSFLAMLKNMHDSYGFVFSLYIQNIPTSISTKHQGELRAASSWLKWGIHALNGGNYQSSSYDQGKSDWNKMVNAILTLTGTHNAIDRIPRLHQFYGSEAALQGMRDAKLGAKGFLSTDDTRDAYYLSKDKLNYLYEGENDHLTDFKNSLVFYRTDLRLDWFSGAGFTYNAAAGMSNHEPLDTSDIAGELERRFNDALYINTWGCYAIFTHEWQPESAIRNALTAIGEFANEHNIPFDFPQNHQASISQGDIQSVVDTGSDIKVDSSLSETSENPVQNKVVNSSINSLLDTDATLTSYINDLEARIAALESTSGLTLFTISNNLTNVTNSNAAITIAEGRSYSATLTAYSNYIIDSVVITMGDIDITDSVYNDGAINVESVTGDITITAIATFQKPEPIGTYTIEGRDLDIVTDVESMEYTLKKALSGGVTTSRCFADNVTGRAASYTTILKVDGGESVVLNQVISGTTLSYALRTFKDTKLTSTETMEGDFTANKWIATGVTLPSNTQYVLIAFKNGDGNTNFTDEQVKLLPNALTIG